MLKMFALIREKPTGHDDTTVRVARDVVVEAETYEDAKAAVHEQLPEGWRVLSYRVER